MVGIILLIGLVKKNAILMIDFALAAQRNEHRDAKSAIHEACLLRFRPILMTTMAALLEHCLWRWPPASARNCGYRWESRSSAA